MAEGRTGRRGGEERGGAGDRQAALSTAPRAALPGEARIEALDALRGFALLGILIMNVPGFARSVLAVPRPQDLSTLDGAIGFARDLLFQNKFNLLFAFVFGVGFALQLRRLEGALGSADAGAVYRRRLGVLLAIGIGHAALLWPGDVLVPYAVLGALLLAWRRIGERALLFWLVPCVLFLPTLEGLAAQMSAEQLRASFAAYAPIVQRHELAFGHGSFADAVAETMRTFAWYWSSFDGLFTVFASCVHLATGILLGFWVGRRGWIERLGELRRPLLRTQLGALAFAAGCGAAWLALGGAALPVDAPLPLAPSLARGFGRDALALFYAATVLRLATARPGSAPVRVLALAGRMPLSNYLLQTAMCLAIFYAWGLGLWGRTTPAVEVAIAIALFFAVQLPLSAWWLKRFRFGPVEYLWRRLTYGRPAPSANSPASSA